MRSFLVLKSVFNCGDFPIFSTLWGYRIFAGCGVLDGHRICDGCRVFPGVFANYGVVLGSLMAVEPLLV